MNVLVLWEWWCSQYSQSDLISQYIWAIMTVTMLVESYSDEHLSSTNSSAYSLSLWRQLQTLCMTVFSFWHQGWLYRTFYPDYICCNVIKAVIDGVKIGVLNVFFKYIHSYIKWHSTAYVHLLSRRWIESVTSMTVAELISWMSSDDRMCFTVFCKF
jgi:hypothetical protein